MVILFLKGLLLFCGIPTIAMILAFGVLYLAWVFSQRDTTPYEG